MAWLQISSRQVAATSDADSASTMVLVAIINVNHPERGVQIVQRLSGQDLVELFTELDHPNSEQDVVGILLGVPPHLNGSPQLLSIVPLASRSHTKIPSSLPIQPVDSAKPLPSWSKCTPSLNPIVSIPSPSRSRTIGLRVVSAVSKAS